VFDVVRPQQNVSHVAPVSSSIIQLQLYICSICINETNRGIHAPAISMKSAAARQRRAASNAHSHDLSQVLTGALDHRKHLSQRRMQQTAGLS
jgi:hypothetical protein